MVGDTVAGHELGAISLWRQLRGFLKWDVEVDAGASPRATEDIKVRLTITNTAPSGHDWPEIVFMGIRVEGGSYRIRRRGEPRLTRSGSASSSPRVERLRSFDGSVEPEQEPILEPGQSMTYEYTSTYQEVPALEFRVEATVSPYRFFRHYQTLSAPLAHTRPAALAYLRAFNDIHIHSVLQSITALPKPGPDTTLAELRALLAALANGESQAEDIRRRVGNLPRESLSAQGAAHLHEAGIYLQQAAKVCRSLKDALSSTDPGEIASARQALEALERQATQVNRATEELMRSYNIPDEEAHYSYRGL